jgi:hypothetical protein
MRTIKGNVKCRANSIPAALSNLSCSAGWRCFSYSPRSCLPEQSALFDVITPESGHSCLHGQHTQTNKLTIANDEAHLYLFAAKEPRALARSCAS